MNFLKESEHVGDAPQRQQERVDAFTVLGEFLIA
jgi:hypothetical protein